MQTVINIAILGGTFLLTRYTLEKYGSKSATPFQTAVLESIPFIMGLAVGTTL